MPDWSRVQSKHVVAAMREYDDLGSAEFFRRYGLRRARMFTVWHRGNEYDAAPALAAAYFHATTWPVAREELDEDDAAHTLKLLGFDVVEMDQPVTPAPTTRRTTASSRTATAAKPARKSAAKAPAKTPGQAAARKTAAKPTRTVRADPPPPRLCPSCHLAVPASGVCDFCD